MAIPMVIIHLMKINIHLKMIMATLEIEDHQPEVHLQGSAGGRKAANWEDDIYDTNYNNRTRSRGNSDVDRLGSRLGSTRLSPRKSDQQASSSSGGALHRGHHQLLNLISVVHKIKCYTSHCLIYI